MTRARNQLISLETTPYYHCISRCVRRAYLWGEDALTGRNYAHRKTWVLERLQALADSYAIDICAYAVMANHYHLVLRVDVAKAQAWTLPQVAAQWGQLHRLPGLITRYLQAQSTSDAERREAEDRLEQWRERLADLSWFMHSLNEYLARRANREDQCSGRFWEGRFKSQGLLDEAAVLTCMSYVDLNPIRAGLADTPEASDFTSIQQRLRQWAQQDPPTPPAPTLLPLGPAAQDPHPHALGITPAEYLALVDWAGRALREDKRGAIPDTVPPVLQRLGLEPVRYLEHLQGRAATERPTLLGHIERLRHAARTLGRCFIKGMGEAQRLYRPVPAG
jgi:hypothetical protein